MLRLVRLVLGDDWAVDDAATQLLSEVDDPHVLRRLCARVRRAEAERPSRIAARAALTLQEALRRSGAGVCLTWSLGLSTVG
jgi:hypothetical protein